MNPYSDSIRFSKLCTIESPACVDTRIATLATGLYRPAAEPARLTISHFLHWLLQLITTGLLIFAVAIPHCLADKTSSAQQPLIMSIHPYRSAAALVASYKPLAAYLTSKTGQPIKIEISRDYSTHIRLIGEDQVDIAYLGPASYVELVNRFGNKPLLARQAIHGKPTFQGKIIVRQDSTIDSLAGLAGKKFAFGDPVSTMSHLVPRHMLLQAGITLDLLSIHDFLGSHDNVALAVLAGDYDAGAVKQAVYDKYQHRGLKTLADTPELSEHLLVSSNALPEKLRLDIIDALYSLKNEPEGQAIMQHIKTGMSGWVEVSDKDYDNLRIILDALSEAGIQP